MFQAILRASQRAHGGEALRHRPSCSASCTLIALLAGAVVTYPCTCLRSRARRFASVDGCQSAARTAMWV